MITMLHGNSALVRDGRLWTDRKFISGMTEFGQHLQGRNILSVHPRLDWDKRNEVMDLVDVPLSDLGFSVESIQMTSSWRPTVGELERVTPLIRKSSVVYGVGFGINQLALRWKIRLVMMMEYNYLTQLEFGLMGLHGMPRKALRTLGVTRSYVSHTISSVRRADLIHCNGYPSYEEVKFFNPRRFLYLDSRMGEDSLIDEASLEARLAENSPLRLIYSGRFEPAKGTLDAVRVAAELRKAGIAFELDLYGQGSLADEMRELVKKEKLSQEVRIHAAVDYPSLLKISKQKDVFLCCHVQDDPSCTYLEAMGCGLPVVGYANRMLARLCEVSKGGQSGKKRPEAVAGLLVSLSKRTGKLEELSRAARSFAQAHTFEKEFGKRMESLCEVADGG